MTDLTKAVIIRVVANRIINPNPKTPEQRYITDAQRAEDARLKAADASRRSSYLYHTPYVPRTRRLSRAKSTGLNRELPSWFIVPFGILVWLFLISVFVKVYRA